MRLKERYDIRQIPLVIKPVVHILSFLLALPVLLYWLIVRPTLKIEVSGQRHLLATKGGIFCYWHEAISSGLWIFDFRQIALLFHPKWYMLPIYYIFWSVGCRHFVFGSSGNQGRAAQDELRTTLAEGYATIINPDGPAGPPKKLKPGIYHLAKATSAPVIPLQISVSRRLRSFDWDRKFFPLPFATLEVKVGDVMHATADVTKESFLQDLSHRLG